ncbi:MOSC domain-containing protein [Pseudodonghicola flavimaris]|uniref:MOSC domain-containing protein n=1 Tax=Pseudodonghicola flavimaris TaxID=3050036 RepID=A0ABT7F280_9RHOB|nr:MOSC domain-containing protein [Pseudodonghicola flavimaris]MDK3018711.1 MOSC domain-containing protein [Pseudodonghicola flavimaris]
MTAAVRDIWRHPIKAHGRERLAQVDLTVGAALPWDRVWAVAHEAARFDDAAPAWAHCRNFTRAAGSPSLMAIEAEVDEASGRIRLTHPDRPEISIDPADPADAARFIAWAGPITNPDRPQPARLVRAPDQAMTDTDFPSISLINLATHAAVAAEVGQELSPLRWRGNLLLEGLAPWAEMDWPGKRLQIGSAELEVVEPIVRCMATTANPVTGERDADTLGALKRGWGHQICGVYAVVTQAGTIRAGDPIEVRP